MNESERAIRQLIDGVLELAEATRSYASEWGRDPGQLEDLSGKTESVAAQVACLKALVQTEVPADEPPAPVPNPGQIVESLDDIFGAL